MPSRQQISYFGAGPAPLPNDIIEEGAKAFVNYNDTGIGLAEISHRSPTANQILADTKDALIKLYDIPSDEYEIIFMQAGGTGEFSAVVQNLVPVWIERRRRKAVKDLGEGKDEEVLARVKKEIQEELRLDYIVTGSWSLKASQEASRLLGARYVNVVVDARKANSGKFGKIPDESSWNLTPTRKQGGPGPALTWYCDNETVDGVEFASFPQSLESASPPEDDNDRMIAVDMSSNFLSRPVDVRKYSVVFGGAQKNVGVTGITIVIVKKALLSDYPDAIFLQQLGLSGLPGPIMLDYPIIAKNNSLYNTLPIFNLYIATRVMQTLVKQFGGNIAGQQELADKKAHLLYGVLDAHPDVYQVVPDKSVRSRMNICFRIKGGDEAAEKEFIKGAESKGLMGLKGHRSVGGIRASNYNAVTMESAEKLCKWLEDFAKGSK